MKVVSQLRTFSLHEYLFKIFLADISLFLLVYWFGPLLTSVLGSKARVDPSLDVYES